MHLQPVSQSDSQPAGQHNNTKTREGAAEEDEERWFRSAQPISLQWGAPYEGNINEEGVFKEREGEGKAGGMEMKEEREEASKWICETAADLFDDQTPRRDFRGGYFYFWKSIAKQQF